MSSQYHPPHHSCHWLAEDSEDMSQWTPGTGAKTSGEEVSLGVVRWSSVVARPEWSLTEMQQKPLRAQTGRAERDPVETLLRLHTVLMILWHKHLCSTETESVQGLSRHAEHHGSNAIAHDECYWPFMP